MKIYDGRYDEEHYIDDRNEESSSFPYILMTKQIMTYDDHSDGMERTQDETNYNSYDNNDNDYDEDDANQFLHENKSNEPKRFLENQNIWTDLSENINPEHTKKVLQNLESLHKPTQFIALFTPIMTTVLTPDFDNKEKLQSCINTCPGWKIYSLEDFFMKEILHTTSFAETVKALCSLEHTVVLPKIFKDAAHEIVDNRYNYHYERWLSCAVDVDQNHQEMHLN